MASPTYHARAHVLRKTNLAEADLILTLLAEDGAIIRAEKVLAAIREVNAHV